MHVPGGQHLAPVDGLDGCIPHSRPGGCLRAKRPLAFPVMWSCPGDIEIRNKPTEVILENQGPWLQGFAIPHSAPLTPQNNLGLLYPPESRGY